MSLKELLTHVIHEIEVDVDRFQGALRRRLHHRRNILIQPYLGFGTAEHYFLHGRVLENRTPHEVQADDSALHNLFTVFLYADSNEITNARLRIRRGAQEWDCTTDDEGYFTIRLEAPGEPGWQQFEVELLDAPLPFEPPVTAVADLLVPPTDADFGVISDIDDTILISEATNKLKALSLMLLHNARTRFPFAGVAALYHALQSGPHAPVHGRGHNPIFYVSSSPWNLYEMLTDFFHLQQIPRGPIFLQDYGFTPDQLLISSHAKHKKRHINHILNTYPYLKFVLMGDSGQKDPEIYHQVVQEHPERILAIYIRDVSDDKRDAAVEQIAAQVEATGVPMRLVPNSLVAAEHAAQIGLIAPAQLPLIRQAMQTDEK